MSVHDLTTVVVVGGVEVPVLEWWLNLDQGWWPYARGEIVVPATTQTTAVDPRDVTRVQLQAVQRWMGSATLDDLTTAWAGQTLDDLTTAWAGQTLDVLTMAWTDLWGNAAPRATSRLDADLVVRTRTIDLVAGTVTLAVASDDALAADCKPQVFPFARTQLGLAIISLLESAHLPVRVETGPLMQLTVPPVVMPIDPFRIYDGIMTAAANAGVRVWCDETGVWRAGAFDAVPSTTVHLSRVISARDIIDRDGEWADAVNVSVTQSEPPLTYLLVRPTVKAARPYKVHDTVEFTTNDGVAANTWADAVLARLDSRGRTLTITAPIDLDLRPGVAFTTGTPSLPALSGQVAAVEWRVTHTQADMAITTRDTIQ